MNAVTRTSMAEFAAMIRRGEFKFIHSPADSDQLYDLRRDPGERHNLAVEAAQAPLVAAFHADVAKRWDLATLDAEVRASQRRRRHVDVRIAEKIPVALRHGEGIMRMRE